MIKTHKVSREILPRHHQQKWHVKTLLHRHLQYWSSSYNNKSNRSSNNNRNNRHYNTCWKEPQCWTTCLSLMPNETTQKLPTVILDFWVSVSFVKHEVLKSYFSPVITVWFASIVRTIVWCFVPFAALPLPSEFVQLNLFDCFNLEYIRPIHSCKRNNNRYLIAFKSTSRSSTNVQMVVARKKIDHTIIGKGSELY